MRFYTRQFAKVWRTKSALALETLTLLSLNLSAQLSPQLSLDQLAEAIRV